MNKRGPAKDEARSDGSDATAGRASVLNTAKTIAWSFFGVRKRGDHEHAGTHISPVHVVIAGFVGVFALVAGLIVLVNWVVA